MNIYIESRIADIKNFNIDFNFIFDFPSECAFTILIETDVLISTGVMLKNLNPVKNVKLFDLAPN